jgi:hypothetical protein
MSERKQERMSSAEFRERGSSEHQEQCAVISWARAHEHVYPDLRWLAAIPNGGHRHKAVAAKLKAEGVQRGVPDLMLTVPMNKYHGLFIELKYGRNKPTDNQITWLAHLMLRDYFAVIACSAAEAIQVLEWYVKGAK